MTENNKYPIRSMFVASKDHLLLEFDLSQAESWVFSHLAREEKMKHFLKNSDIHSEAGLFIYNVNDISQVTYNQRFVGKHSNHQLSYGSSHYRLTQYINSESDNPPYIVITIAEGKNVFDKWHILFPRVREYHLEIQESTKYTHKLTTPHGRERTFYAEWGSELWKEMYANLPQSTVADHLNGMIQDELGIPGGLIEVKRQIKEIKILHQGHDSFIGEAHKDIANSLVEPIVKLIRRPMVINKEEFVIPVDAKIGERWGCLEKVEVK